MSRRDDGGPAFPTDAVSQNQASGETTVHQPYGGMTLRDYFAAKAMHALLADSAWTIEAAGDQPAQAHHVAAEAYMLADAMLKARAA